MSVQFTCTASGGTGSYSFSWNFGDGESSTQQNPAHVYNKIGNFTAAVTITSGSSTTSSNVTVAVFIERSVTVSGGGGSAEVTFTTASSGRFRITLRGASNMVPYGYLQGPGYSDYYPRQDTSNNGTNTAEVNLNQAGAFSLTVFDGNNVGGTVTVKIEAI